MNLNNIACRLGTHQRETRSDKSGFWGECIHCKKRFGFVSSEAMRRLIDRDLADRLIKSDNDHDRKNLLLSRGWSTWYSDNYWVHEKTVEDISRQDYTEYGLSLEEAYAFETNPGSRPWSGQFLHGALRWRRGVDGKTEELP